MAVSSVVQWLQFCFFFRCFFYSVAAPLKWSKPKKGFQFFFFRVTEQLSFFRESKLGRVPSLRGFEGNSASGSLHLGCLVTSRTGAMAAQGICRMLLERMLKEKYFYTAPLFARTSLALAISRPAHQAQKAGISEGCSWTLPGVSMTLNPWGHDPTILGNDPPFLWGQKETPGIDKIRPMVRVAMGFPWSPFHEAWAPREPNHALASFGLRPLSGRKGSYQLVGYETDPTPALVAKSFVKLLEDVFRLTALTDAPSFEWTGVSWPSGSRRLRPGLGPGICSQKLRNHSWLGSRDGSQPSRMDDHLPTYQRANEQNGGLKSS